MEPIPELPTAPFCLAPSAEVEPASFVMPAGACDTHAHAISPSSAYPMAPSRSYTPPPAPGKRYLAMLVATGCSRGVLVQISVYGTDNRYLLEVLGQSPGRLRGIAVVTPEVTDRELESMHVAGVRGLRINVLFPGAGLSVEAMEILARRKADVLMVALHNHDVSHHRRFGIQSTTPANDMIMFHRAGEAGAEGIGRSIGSSPRIVRHRL